jgi:hypothetical protein
MKRYLQILCTALLLAACSNPPPQPTQPTQVASPAISTAPAATAEPSQPPATALPATVTTAPQIPTAETPPSGEAWARHEFGAAWSLEVPTGWEIRDAGAHEGALALEGDFEGSRYAANFSYPIFESFPSSIDAWVEQSVQESFPAGTSLTIVDTTVAGAPARIVRSVTTPEGPSDQVFIWSGPDRNPRRVSLTQIDGSQPNPDSMARLLDRLLAGVGA